MDQHADNTPEAIRLGSYSRKIDDQFDQLKAAEDAVFNARATAAIAVVTLVIVLVKWLAAPALLGCAL